MFDGQKHFMLTGSEKWYAKLPFVSSVLMVVAERIA